MSIEFNIFRQRPVEALLPKARAKGVGIITRVPLASGLLTGKFGKQMVFKEGDHH